MSTAPEVTVARQLGIRVWGFSLITNKGITEIEDNKNGASHGEVMEAAKLREKDLRNFVSLFIKQYLSQHM